MCFFACCRKNCKVNPNVGLAPTFRLNNGNKIPIIGLGTWNWEVADIDKDKKGEVADIGKEDKKVADIDKDKKAEVADISKEDKKVPDTDKGDKKGDVPDTDKDEKKESEESKVTLAVKDAISVGYRHFDCAMMYENEKEVGEGIKAMLEEGVVTREDLFLTSKLWNTFHPPDLVVPALKESLASLGVDYLDLYLIHWPVALKEGKELLPKDKDEKFIFSDADYVDTWKAMEECVGLGLTKSIGLSNFNSEQIDRILHKCKIKPVINQIECHPYLTQNKLIELCQSKQIAVTAYSPLGSPSRPWRLPTDPILLEEEIILEIAKKFKKTPAQIVLRWQTQRGVIVIPKSFSPDRIAENFDIFDFSLHEYDCSKIESLNTNSRALPNEWFKDSKDYPFNIEF